MKTKNTSVIAQNKDVVAAVAALALAWSVPFISMLFTGEMGWDETDFIIIGILVGGAGALFVVLSRMVNSTQKKILIGVIVALAVMWLWAELAVGIFTNWGS